MQRILTVRALPATIAAARRCPQRAPHVRNACQTGDCAVFVHQR